MKPELVEDEFCEKCGTNLVWWKSKKGKKVYTDGEGDLFCSKGCFRKFTEEFLKEVL